MTAIDWWWTGRNNATDNTPGYRLGYWPPRGAGFVSGVLYRVGWAYGKISPSPRL